MQISCLRATGERERERGGEPVKWPVAVLSCTYLAILYSSGGRLPRRHFGSDQTLTDSHHCHSTRRRSDQGQRFQPQPHLPSPLTPPQIQSRCPQPLLTLFRIHTAPHPFKQRRDTESYLPQGQRQRQRLAICQCTTHTTPHKSIPSTGIATASVTCLQAPLSNEVDGPSYHQHAIWITPSSKR